MADEFTGKATVYDKARPGYAPAALNFILDLVGITGASIADIGAGTGKFSALLAGRGCNVVAVEPNADMRSRLPALPNLRAIDGMAEATGLPDRSVDAVTCAQAFHWFVSEKFKAECQRILRPGGRVFVVYNNPRCTESSVHSELDWHAKYDPEQWKRNDAAILAFFGGELRREAFENQINFNRELYEAYMLSHSNSPRLGDEDYERFIASVAEIFKRCNVDGKMLLPLETVVCTDI